MVRAGILRISIGLIVCLLLFACGEDKKEPVKTKEKQVRQKASRPEFNVDSAYHFIERQVSYGPRVPNTAAHKKAGNYLASKLRSYQFEVTEQEAQVVAFNGTKLNIKNIIGAYRAELNNRVLLYSHWDSRPFADQDDERKDEPILAANDGASGVGVLLEIARQIEMKQPNIGVDIIFFDAEDYGQSDGKLESWCLGSQYWSNNPHKMGYSANFGILLDMVGAKDAYFTKEQYSMYYASTYVQHVWNIAKDLGHDNHFISKVTNHVGVDDHVFVNKIAKIPSIDIIQFYPPTKSFAPHWHTHDDDMSVIDKETIEAVGETVLATVMEEGK